MIAPRPLERAAADTLPIRNGAFVAIVGPSGAGKDTLIAHAREALADEPRVEFVRRVITRQSDGQTEDHDTLDDKAFVAAQANGAFALAWEAHGLRYGLPASIDDAIDAGRVTVANVSRGALPALRLRYANVAVVEVSADLETLAARLAGRGRESREEIIARLARTITCDTTGSSIALDNSGAKEIAGDRLVAIIRETLGPGMCAPD